MAPNTSHGRPSAYFPQQYVKVLGFLRAASFPPPRPAPSQHSLGLLPALPAAMIPQGKEAFETTSRESKVAPQTSPLRVKAPPISGNQPSAVFPGLHMSTHVFDVATDQYKEKLG